MRKPARPWLLGSGLGLAGLLALLAVTAITHRDTRATTVRVGVYENAPKVYTRPDGRPAGLFIDLLRPIARRAHWKLRFVHCDWEQCLQKLRDGGIDLMPDVAYSAERARYLAFPATAVVHAWSEVYARKPLDVRSISDLAGHRVALLRDSVQQHYFAHLMKSAGLSFTPVPVDSYEDGFRAVRSGRADAVVCNNFYAARHPVTPPVAETPIVFQPVGLYFAAARGAHPALLQTINRDLSRWRRNPDSIYYKVLRSSMEPAPVEVVPPTLWLGLLIAIGLVVLFVTASLVLRWKVRQRTADLARTTRHLDEVLRASPAIIYRLRQEGGEWVPDWVSPNIRRLFGFDEDAVLAPGWWSRQLHPQDRNMALERMRNLPNDGTVVYEYRIIDAHHTTRYIRDEMRVTPARYGQPRTVFGTWNDVTQSRLQAQRIDFLTYHDSLTRLPNRLQLTRHLDTALERARMRSADPDPLTVLWVDLDRFKNINDTLGHTAGDAFLLRVAERLGTAVNSPGTLARVGGDEFVILLETEAGTHRAIALAEQVLANFARPFDAAGRTLTITASIGISVYPGHGDDAETLLRHAEVAMYEAKGRDRNTWCLFDPSLSSAVVERLALENTLRGAIDRNELVLHYQPQFSLASGEPVGIEALVRWNHPDSGLLAPSQFIGLAEDCGMIHAIGAWVLVEACRQMVLWQRRGLDIPTISVNLSVRQIERSELTGLVTRALADSGLDAGRLELELTESTIMRDPEQANWTLTALKNLGVKLSIDDFGTGHSSLAYLKRLPLDRLKIDHSFVRDIGRDPDDEAISRAVIELAHTLGLSTVAEGVERDDQVAFLRREGCDAVQGYLYCRPLAADALADFLSGRQAASGTYP